MNILSIQFNFFNFRIVEKLAEQNINVIIIASSDILSCSNYLKKKYKNIEFKFLSIDLSNENAYEEVIKNIKNYEIGILFNNVGYLNCIVSDIYSIKF